MIKHIVFFKLKDRSPEKVEATVQVLRNMEGKIPQLLSIEVGADLIHSERSFDIALVTVGSIHGRFAGLPGSSGPQGSYCPYQ